MKQPTARLGLRIHEQTKQELEEMAIGLGVKPSHLVERLILNYRRGRYTRDRNSYLLRVKRVLGMIPER
jgi:hypothetical protein